MARWAAGKLHTGLKAEDQQHSLLLLPTVAVACLPHASSALTRPLLEPSCWAEHGAEDAARTADFMRSYHAESYVFHRDLSGRLCAIGQADAAHGGAGARMASQARASARASAETVVPVAVAVEVMERL